MSEEKPETIRTVATVSVNAQAAPPEVDSERLSRVIANQLRTVATLREIVILSHEARDCLMGSPTNMKGLRAFECVEQIVLMATAAVNAHDRGPGSGRKKNT